VVGEGSMGGERDLWVVGKGSLGGGEGSMGGVSLCTGLVYSAISSKA
jgi:hypothetical protein